MQSAETKHKNLKEAPSLQIFTTDNPAIDPEVTLRRIRKKWY